MDFTANQIIELLPLQFNLVGEVNFTSYITTTTRIYETYSAFPILYFLMCKREAVDYLLGHHWQEFNNKTGPVSRDERQIFQNLMELKKELSDAIVLANKQQTSLNGMLIGQIKATSPELWTVWGGPNSILWRGMPSRRLPDNWDASI